MDSLLPLGGMQIVLSGDFRQITFTTDITVLVFTHGQLYTAAFEGAQS
jgi:hypothetical protein